MDKFLKVFFFLTALGVFLWLALLAGCEPSYGPQLETECDYSTPRSIVVVEYDNESELEKAYESLNDDFQAREVRTYGFATYHVFRDPVTLEVTNELHKLHVLKVRGQNDHDRIETIGHELMHSFCGAWHPPVGS